MKKSIYKLFLILMVSLSLASGPAAQNEVARMLERLSEADVMQDQDLDEEMQHGTKKTP